MSARKKPMDIKIWQAAWRALGVATRVLRKGEISEADREAFFREKAIIDPPPPRPKSRRKK